MWTGFGLLSPNQRINRFDKYACVTDALDWLFAREESEPRHQRRSRLCFAPLTAGSYWYASWRDRLLTTGKQNQIWSGHEDGVIRVWDATAVEVTFASLYYEFTLFAHTYSRAQEKRRLNVHEPDCVRALTASSSYVISGDVNGKVVIWDPRLYAVIQEFRVGAAVLALEASSDV
jgi:hypothetical protein